jgi:single-stranded DNA-binding protein
MYFRHGICIDLVNNLTKYHIMPNRTINLTGLTGKSLNIIHLEDTSMASIGLAASENSAQKWYKLVAFGQMAHFIKDHLTKETKITIEGTLLEDKPCSNGYTHEVLLTDIALA